MSSNYLEVAVAAYAHKLQDHVFVLPHKTIMVTCMTIQAPNPFSGIDLALVT